VEKTKAEKLVKSDDRSFLRILLVKTWLRQVLVENLAENLKEFSHGKTIYSKKEWNFLISAMYERI
jgi:hypothetical protein